MISINITGLGPRKFRTRIVELGDQSVWTDTPSEKARKVQYLILVSSLNGAIVC